LDRSVTIRYFKIDPVGQTQSFPNAVELAHQLGHSPEHRERTIGPDVVVRLENRLMSRGLLFGEVVRVQKENIPPEAQSAGLVPLQIGGLGHSVAFAFDEQSGIIAIQFDARGVSLGRLLDYLTNVGGGGNYIYNPIVNEDAWERYNRGQPRNLTFSVAAPQNLQNIPGLPGGVLAASRHLAEITHAPIVTVEVSMGSFKGSLFKNAVDQIVRSFSSEDHQGDVRSLTVRTKEEGHPADEIDFIKDLARDREVLDLPPADPAGHIQRRYAFIERAFGARLGVLREMYG